MAFVSFSSQLIVDNSTAVSNVFMNEHLPYCNGDCARVYLYGLYMCSSSNRYDNELGHFSNILGLSEEDVISAFSFWQERGLVQVLSIKPIEVKYLPIKQNAFKIKKIASGKYDDFNAQMGSIIQDRMITPTEFSEYYAFLESFHVEPAALVMIAKYCVNIKGANVGYSYILTVAKNWAFAGIKTVEAVEEKLSIEQSNSANVARILKLLGVKRAAEPNDFELYNKWVKKLGYSHEIIEYISKNTRGSMTKLDNQIMKFFELKLFDKKEITEYESTKKELVATAISINKKIGVYYENVESIIEEYIVPWKLKGFDELTLLSVASFCFRSGKRTLAEMDNVINKFYKLGITTPSAIDNFINEKVATDKTIKELLVKLGITREVNFLDRDFYSTWTNVWNFSSEIIDYAMSLSIGKTSPMAYMNKILATYFEKKITTLDKAKAVNYSPAPVSITRHSYSDDELRSLSISMDEVKI